MRVPSRATPAFARTIGIEYSGAEAATASLRGLSVYTVGYSTPIEVPPPLSPQKYWRGTGSRNGWVGRIVAKDDALMELCDQLEASLVAAADSRSRLLNALIS